MKRKTFLGIFLMLGASVGLACSTNAMPPLGVIKVSAFSIAKEIRAGGTKGALHRAFLKSLDKRAETLLGTSVWQDNGWKGHVAYSTPVGGMYLVYMEKECGRKAADKPTQPPTSSNGGSGGGGGAGGTGGGSLIGGGCYGNCGKKPTVDVGDIQPI